MQLSVRGCQLHDLSSVEGSDVNLPRQKHHDVKTIPPPETSDDKDLTDGNSPRLSSLVSPHSSFGDALFWLAVPRTITSSVRLPVSAMM